MTHCRFATENPRPWRMDGSATLNDRRVDEIEEPGEADQRERELAAAGGEERVVVG
jgi:hypothetical protein